jgi:hypothetical protein
MKNYILFLLLILFLIKCDSNGIKKDLNNGVLVINNPEHGLWQNKSTPPLSFELEKIFGKENEPIEEVLASTSYVFTDNNRNVFIFDHRDNHLVSFDSSGKFLWSKGRKGQGPGEFDNVRGIVFDGNKYIYVCNSSGLQIDHYDLTGNYLTSFKLSELNIGRVSLNAFIEPNVLVLSQSPIGKIGLDIIFLEFGDSLKIKTKIDIIEDIGVEIPFGVSAGMDVTVNSNEIVVAKIHNYEFNYYNFEGKLIKKVTRDFNKLVRPVIKSTSISV